MSNTQAHLILESVDIHDQDLDMEALATLLEEQLDEDIYMF